MARVMEKVIPAKTTVEQINCLATIERAMITASTAALRLGDKENAATFCKLKNWAADQYNKAFKEHVKADPKSITKKK